MWAGICKAMSLAYLSARIDMVNGMVTVAEGFADVLPECGYEKERRDVLFTKARTAKGGELYQMWKKYFAIETAGSDIIKKYVRGSDRVRAVGRAQEEGEHRLGAHPQDGGCADGLADDVAPACSRSITRSFVLGVFEAAQ